MKTMMKRTNFRVVAPLLALIFTVGAIDGLAQARKPVLRRTTARRSAVKPVPRLYTMPVGTRLRARIDDTLSSKTARVGETFTATVTSPVYSSNGVLIVPEGSTLTGRVDS